MSKMRSHQPCDVAEEHKSPEFSALNPRGQMPVLVDGDIVVCESLAALLYLDDAYPEHSLLPSGRKERALVSHHAREELLSVLLKNGKECQLSGDSEPSQLQY